ncbi:hypothetical protein FQN54_003210 [Arachnomyces sp. PD_36]|nr:hypothetical protein FQN54_003210 [Arachnomyces sp. PD_36]
MSFLNSVLSSIETGKVSQNPPQPSIRAPASSLPTQHARTAASKSTEHRSNTPQNTNGSTVGQKRKAENELRRPDNPYGREPDRYTSTKDAPLSTLAARARQSKTPVSQVARTKPTNTNGTSTTPKKQPPAPPAIPSKPPPKGSYADIMRMAQQAQQKAPTQVGMIKHQSVPKEKLSKAERKKLALEQKAKERETKLGKKPGSAGTMATQKAGAPVVKKREREESGYKGTARPTAPPAAPAYKGTAGLSSRRGEGNATNASRDKARSRHARPTQRDEYLATDEEDEGDGYGYDDYDDGYSDESSDMEAGLMDVEEEEQGALKLAKREDELELQAEMAAKKEKLERKKRLAQLAAKSRR